MALIDEFLYALGFQADLRGGQAFDEQLQRIGDHGESTRHSLLSTITAANLLSSALEKGAEMAKEVGGEFIRTAKEMEDMKVTFESLYTSAAEGEEKFKWLVQFSRNNPVMGLESAKEAFLSLKNNGVEPTAAAMKAMGDTMAAMPGIGYMLGKDVGELLEGRYAMGGAIAQAGIKLHKSSKGGETSYSGSYINREGVKVPVKLDISDANKTIEQLTAILNDRFGGTMEKHAKTMTGLIARWGNDWQVFQMQIMDNHVFSSLEDELYNLISQWEAWAKSPDAHQMLYGIGLILNAIVRIIGEAISITGALIAKFTEWFGTSNSIAIVLGTMFIASKWASIIGMVIKLAGAFKEVYAALQLVAEGEKVVSVLGLLMDGVLSPLNLIVVAVMAVGAGIAYMVKKWHDFRLGLLDSGPMHSVLQGLEHFFIRIRASLEYLFGSIKIGLLDVQSFAAKAKIMNDLTPEQRKELEGLRASHTQGMGGYVDKQLSIADSEQNRQEDFVRFARNEKKVHGDWNQSQIWAAYKQQQMKGSADMLTGDIAAITSKRYSPHTALGITPGTSQAPVVKSDDHSFHNHGPVTVYANDPQGFAAGMRDAVSGTDGHNSLAAGMAGANAGLASTQQNYSTGGKKY